MMRKESFINNYFYHLYNRGVEKRDVFLNSDDYHRFLESLEVFNCFENIKVFYERRRRLKQVKPVTRKPLVLICAYCLMSNHFHLLLKQLVKGGISKFLQKLTTAYTMFFNNKYKREGSLFQGTFKAVLVETEAQLLHLSRYIHLNPIKDQLETASYGEKSRLLKKLSGYFWSSYPAFIGERKPNIAIGLEEILASFGSKLTNEKACQAYKKFINSYVLGEEEIIRDLLLDSKS